MVSGQFNLNPDKTDVEPSNSPGDNRQEVIIEGDVEPSADQLAQAAADLNGAADGIPGDPAPQAPVAPQIPPSVQNRMDIMNRQAAARREEMVADQGFGPVVEDASGKDPNPHADNMNAQNIYYGQFGDPNSNFAGEKLADAPQTPDTPIPANPEPGAEDAADLVTVNVDGVERQVSQDELVRSFQKDGTADKRLNDATTILQQAQSAAAANLQPTATTPADQSETEQIPTDALSEPGLSDDDYMEFAEKIQLGETKEGAEALKDLMTQVAARQQDTASPVDPSVLVKQVVSEVRDSTLSETARQTFEQGFPDIIADPQLHQMAGRNAIEVMVEDFAANGANDEMIAHARANPDQAAQAHRAMRQSGEFSGLKTPDELYTEAGNRTRSWLSGISGQPSQGDVPKTEAQNPNPAVPRAERARAAQQSPQMRTAPVTPQAKQTAKVKSPSDVIASMKRGRGQFPAGQAAGQR